MIDQKSLMEMVCYDPDTGEFTWIKSERNGHVGKLAGSLRKRTGYISINFSREFYQAHRLAWLYIHGRWPDLYIDHINGNKSDNRISNLREASQSQNAANSKIGAANKTGLKGVSYDKRKGKFRACLGKDSKQIFLGYYDRAEDASAAYVRATQEVYGEFARIR